MSIHIKGVNKYFVRDKEKTHTLSHIDLEFKKGEFICLLGPSGCGKSTLLNIIAGLEKPTEGEISFHGQGILGPGPDRAMMFQDSALFPWLRVQENVEFGMKVLGISKEEREKKALHYLKMVHLTKFKDAYIHELSGGMRQRVALARALSMDSEVLLMDEPFAALDSQTKNLLQMELQQIWQETGKTIIFVTHNVEEAVLLATRVIVMAARPGRIKKDFPIQLARPRHMEDINVTYVMKEVMKELREEVEKVAKAEYDNDWSLEKDYVLPGDSVDMGGGL